jgi:hypothetical protein
VRGQFNVQVVNAQQFCPHKRGGRSRGGRMIGGLLYIEFKPSTKHIQMQIDFLMQ